MAGTRAKATVQKTVPTQDVEAQAQVLAGVQEEPQDNGVQEGAPVIDQNGKEVLFEGGPTMDEVESWKQRYKQVYLTQIDDEVYIWRPLNRSEWRHIKTIPNADQFYQEETICEKCVIWPKFERAKIKFGKAGIPTTIAEQIIEKSGFVPDNTTAIPL